MVLVDDIPPTYLTSSQLAQRLIEQWDQGSRTWRLRFMKWLIEEREERMLLDEQHRTRKRTRPVSVGDAVIDSRSFDGIYQEPLGPLLFARIVTNLKLSHIMGQTVIKHIQAIETFFNDANGSSFLQHFVQADGPRSVLHVMADEKTPESTFAASTSLLKQMLAAGRFYRELFCEVEGLSVLIQAAAKRLTPKICNNCVDLMIELGSGNPGHCVSLRNGLLCLVGSDKGVLVLAGLRVLDGLLSYESHHFVLSNLENERDCFILPVLNAMRTHHHDIEIMYRAELALRYLVPLCTNKEAVISRLLGVIRERSRSSRDEEPQPDFKASIYSVLRQVLERDPIQFFARFISCGVPVTLFRVIASKRNCVDGVVVPGSLQEFEAAASVLSSLHNISQNGVILPESHADACATYQRLISEILDGHPVITRLLGSPEDLVGELPLREDVMKTMRSRLRSLPQSSDFDDAATQSRPFFLTSLAPSDVVTSTADMSFDNDSQLDERGSLALSVLWRKMGFIRGEPEWPKRPLRWHRRAKQFDAAPKQQGEPIYKEAMDRVMNRSLATYKPEPSSRMVISTAAAKTKTATRVITAKARFAKMQDPNNDSQELVGAFLPRITAKSLNTRAMDAAEVHGIVPSMP